MWWNLKPNVSEPSLVRRPEIPMAPFNGIPCILNRFSCSWVHFYQWHATAVKVMRFSPTRRSSRKLLTKQGLVRSVCLTGQGPTLSDPSPSHWPGFNSCLWDWQCFITTVSARTHWHRVERHWKRLGACPRSLRPQYGPMFYRPHIFIFLTDMHKMKLSVLT